MSTHSPSGPGSRARGGFPRLVMLLAVRDEADVLSENLWFHLNQGVDFVLITDNASCDGSRDIAAEFERLGLAHVIDEPRLDKSQGQWMTRMAHLARERFHADWVLASDADEFWYAKSGSLKTDLVATSATVLKVRRRNLIPCLSDTADPAFRFWQAIVRTRQPLNGQDLRPSVDSEIPESLLLYGCGPKVVARTTGLEAIGHGNHDVTIRERREQVSENVEIYHYPIRTFEQFRRKVHNHGSSYAINTDLPQTHSWHLRRWYRILQQGRLEQEYANQLLTPDAFARYLAAGVVELDLTMLRLADAGRMQATSTPLGVGLVLPEPTAFQFEVLSGHEYPLPALRNYTPGTIVDIGANAGAASVYFARQYPNARILAFEPSSRNLAVLTENARAHPNIRVFPFGLSNADRVASMALGGVGLIDSLYRRPPTPESVETVCLRAATRMLESESCFPLSILKLDTEGCEPEILTDLRDRLSDIDYICLEYHSEDDRRAIDALLGTTHLLVHARVAHAHRGTLAFLHHRLAVEHGLGGVAVGERPAQQPTVAS